MTQQLSTPPSAKPRTGNGSAPKAYMVGGGIGSLAAAAFLIRDGNVPGHNITIYELLGIEREIPPILHHDDSIKVKFDAVVKAFR